MKESIKTKEKNYGGEKKQEKKTKNDKNDFSYFFSTLGGTSTGLEGHQHDKSRALGYSTLFAEGKLIDCNCHS